MPERRKYPRYQVHQVVELSLGRENFIDLEPINVSANGILCTSDKAIELSSKYFVLLSVELEGKHEEIQAEGVVARQDVGDNGKYYFGIELIDFRGNDQEKYKQFIQNMQ
ncbi:MAG: PilZ domain-containing protein [Spirochaetia bacterium]